VVLSVEQLELGFQSLPFLRQLGQELAVPVVVLFYFILFYFILFYFIFVGFLSFSLGGGVYGLEKIGVGVATTTRGK